MNLKIGIVDDHKLFAKSLGIMLENSGNFEVVTECASGQELQNYLSLKNNIPDILLIDINMPEMDGVKLAGWVSEHFPEIKMIALTMNSNEDSIIKMFKAGCCSYLLKEIHPAELTKALKEVFEFGYYSSDITKLGSIRDLFRNERENKINITQKELTFLNLACSELTYKQVADKMGLSERTIDGYRESLFKKLGAQSRVGLCMTAIRMKLISL